MIEINKKIILFSVIIPTFNHGHLLGRALQSVLDQTCADWEAIVIDNNSHDNTDEVMRCFIDPRINLLKINNNGVIAASRNMGIRNARGKWIAFLDSDDWWLPNKLEVCLKHAADQVDLIYHDLKIVNDSQPTLQRRKIRSWQVRRPVSIDLLVRGNPIANSSVVVRRELLNLAGGLNENREMIACEDYNAWLRIGQLTENFCYINQVLGCYLQHGQGVSRKDMSAPARCASAEFRPLLSKRQNSRLESNLQFTRAKFAFGMKDYVTARKSLLFCFFHGRLPTKAKSLFLLVATLAL